MKTKTSPLSIQRKLLHWQKENEEEKKEPDIIFTFFRLGENRRKNINIAQPKIISSDNFLINYFSVFSDAFIRINSESLGSVTMFASGMLRRIHLKR